MTEYLVLKRIPTGDTKVGLVEALTDLGFVHPDTPGPKHYFVIHGYRPDLLGCRVSCANCGYTEFKKDSNENLYCVMCGTGGVRTQGNNVVLIEPAGKMLAKEVDLLLEQRNKARGQRDKARGEREKVKVERDEAKAEAMTALEVVEKMTAEREKRPKIDPTTLPENYFIILESHPDRPFTRVPCAKCGYTEFCKDPGTGFLHCGKCNALAYEVIRHDVKPLLKFLSCPRCNRMLTTLSEHLPPGRCCLCGAELSPPVCPHCGHDTFEPVSPFTFGTFNADGTLANPHLYLFRCVSCREKVGTLPLVVSP